MGPGYNRARWGGSARSFAIRSRSSSRSSSHEDRVAAYLIREHERGRSLAEILEDPYVKNRTTPLERERLLDRPELIRALGDDVVTAARAETKLDLLSDLLLAGELDRFGADRDVPGGEAVRLEEDDVVGRAAARRSLPRRPPAARAPRASRGRRARRARSGRRTRASHCSTESQHTKTARSRTTLSSSRARGSLAPTAQTSAPGCSHSPRSTGSLEVVTVTTTSCSAGSRWLSAASAPTFLQNASGSSRSGSRRRRARCPAAPRGCRRPGSRPASRSR